MIRSEEKDLREGLVYDPYVKRYDSSFWQGDTANLLFDSVKNRIKIGDTGLVGSASSFSQYLYGDFEFVMTIDSLSPDSNDSEKYFGLRNAGDSLQRGAVYFNLSYDTTAADSSDTTRPFSVVAFDEQGTRQRKFVEWDTDWGGGGRVARFRISWEEDGYYFSVNDTAVALLGDVTTGTRNGIGTARANVNTSIPQALRLSNRSLDTSDTAVTSFALINVRNTRKLI